MVSWERESKMSKVLVITTGLRERLDMDSIVKSEFTEATKMKSKKVNAVFLILLLAAITLTVSCSKTPTSDGVGDDVNVLNYRIADKTEGAELLLSNDAYYDGMTQNELDFKMQKTGATLDEYKTFVREQVIDFTDEQKAIIDRHMERIGKVLAERGYQIPELEQIVFINTTMQEEYGAAAYTHGTQIYISGDYITEIELEDQGAEYLDLIFAHELFHCMTRSSSDFRSEMYEIIHFTTQDDEYELPPSVKEYFISNPDVEHHNAFATFVINDKNIDCFAALVTTRHFEKAGDDFFDLGTTALVPVDGTDIYYTPEDAENFDEVFGRNTDYVVDPEECLADNFGLLIAYGMEGPDGSGYPDPDIISSIENTLKRGQE
jgi:hypothetical protein